MKALNINLIISETDQIIINLHYFAGLLEKQKNCNQTFSGSERLRLAANDLSEVVSSIKNSNLDMRGDS